MSPCLLRGALVFLLLVGFSAHASAAPGKLDARARAALARLRANGQSIEAMRSTGAAIDRDGALDVFIRGAVTRSQLEAAGARVRTSLPGLFTASIPASAVSLVEALEGVVAIRAGAPCEPELNVSAPTTGVSLLRGPGPAFDGLNGQGVIIGIVDSGLDYGHADFQNSTGGTRILNIWDQEAIGGGPPGLPFPYGKEWTQAEIGAGSCLQVDTDEHGTHIAGIAAGDGSQTGGSTPAFAYAGIAPQADIIAVKTDFQTPEVIDAIDYVFRKATALGKNAVVNLSLGSHYGSHDGVSDFEQAVTALSGPGRIVVKSAGNDRGKAVHAQVNATAGGAPATLSVTGSAADRFFAIDGYYNGTEKLRVRLNTPNGTTIGPLSLNQENAPWPGQSTQNGDVYFVHDSLSSARRNVYIEVYSPAANKSMNGTWTITLIADQLGAANGEVDLWRYNATSGLTADFVTGNLPTQELITEPGNAANTVTVGAWVTKVNWTGCNGLTANYPGTPAAGNLAPFSSPGPTRDGRQKPDLVAPGTAIGSATSFDASHTCPAPIGSELLDDGMNHRMFQGTSISTPHVTGAVALLLQRFGAMTPQQVLSYLSTHAHADGFTGTVPTKDWGYGKLYIDELVDPVVHVLNPNGGEQRLIGQTSQLTWTATDSLGSVAGVDLQLSRSGPNGPFENIALGVPNTGTYNWAVTGPATRPKANYLRVVAHDTHANVGSDLSDAGFTIATSTAVGQRETATFALSRVGPNPTTGETYAEFCVGREAPIRLSIHDVQGRAVAVLANGIHPPGRYSVTWNGTQGHATAGGLYFVRYDTPEGRFVRRIAVMR